MIKRMNYILLFVVVFSIGFGGIFLYQEAKDSKPTSHALAQTFKTVSDLYKDSNFVVKGKVLDGYQKNERNLGSQKIRERLYKVKVKKVIKNTTGESFRKGDVITLAVTMGAQIEGKELELKQNGVKNIKSGNYLLFLNPFRDEENHKLIFLNNSPYYLYKGNGHKFQNISSGSLDKITENELQKMKQKD